MRTPIRNDHCSAWRVLIAGGVIDRKFATLRNDVDDVDAAVSMIAGV